MIAESRVNVVNVAFNDGDVVRCSVVGDNERLFGFALLIAFVCRQWRTLHANVSACLRVWSRSL